MAQVVFGKTADDIKRAILVEDDGTVVTSGGGGGEASGEVEIVEPLPAGTNNIGDVDVLSVIPGTGATNLGKIEDEPHTTGDVGVMILAVRQDTPTTLAGTAGDYTPLQVDGNGRLSVSVGNSTTGIGKAEDAAHGSGDVGVPAWGVRLDTEATFASASGDYTPFSMNSVGALRTAPPTATTATLANVASSATSVTLIASNAARKGLIVYNDSSAILYLKYGATASTTSFTYQLAAGASWTMAVPMYTGVVDGIWASANGFARVTEL
jgi:hypothetical protein